MAESAFNPIFDGDAEGEELGNVVEIFAVIAEWGGKAPPSTWYRYLENLTGTTVRGRNKDDLDLSAIARSGSGETSVVAQEGVIFTKSPSLARSIAFFAYNGVEITDRKTKEHKWIRPDKVYLGRFELSDVIGATPFDVRVLNRMRSVYGRKGKKGEPGTWTITCFEEMKSHHWVGHAPVNCPVCGATHVRWRVGLPTFVKDPGGDVFEAWMRTRFASGVWEVPETESLGNEAPPAPAMSEIVIKDDAENGLANMMRFSPLLTDICAITDDREAILDALDAAFVARMFWSRERRLDARLMAATMYLKRDSNPDVSMLSLSESTFPDIWDVAGPLTPEIAMAHFQRLVALRRAESAEIQVVDLPVMA